MGSSYYLLIKLKKFLKYQINKHILFDSSPAVNCLSTAICCLSLTIRRGDAKSDAIDPRRLFDNWLDEVEGSSKL